MDRRTFLAGSAGAAFLVTRPALVKAAFTVTAVTQVYGDGQKLSHLVLKYDTELDGSSISPSTFQVAGRTVTAAWTTNRGGIDSGDRSATGRYVVLALSLDDAAALLWVQLPRTGGGGP